MMLHSRDLEWNLLTEKVISLSVNWAHADPLSRLSPLPGEAIL